MRDRPAQNRLAQAGHFVRTARCAARASALALSLACIGCGGYGEVSPTAYEYAKALYSITNRQASDRLDAVETDIDAAESRGELTESEADWLKQITAHARSGEWDRASRDARRMMEDQVE